MLQYLAICNNMLILVVNCFSKEWPTRTTGVHWEMEVIGKNKLSLENETLKQ